MGYQEGCGIRTQLCSKIKISKETDIQTLRSEASAIALLGISGQLASEMLALEPRILLDAAGVATGSELADQAAETQAENWQQPVVEEISDVEQLVAAVTEKYGTDNGVADHSNEIIFIDSGIEDISGLLEGIGPSYEVIIIDSDSDGVEQIAAALEGRTGIDAIHIISHGEAGSLQLGNSELSEESIAGKHADEMAIIKAALAGDVDFLIYGCNFADDLSAVEALAAATGADVAASDDLTGAAGLSGDWDLEIKTGSIESRLVQAFGFAGTLDLAIINASVTGANGLAQAILGDGVTINSATYSGGGDQAGTFTTGAGTSFGNNILTFTEGAIFSTGTAVSVGGPNNVDDFTVDAAAGIDGDADFNAVAGGSTFDASFIVIDFTPDVPPGASVGDTARMTMEIVFGSDEYNEYVYGNVNDTLAVIVNGTNQSLVPNGLSIGIDTINDAANFNPAFGASGNDPNPEHTSASFESANPSLFVNNSTAVTNTQMDGYTITIPVTFDVIVGQSNTIKLGIADAADEFNPRFVTRGIAVMQGERVSFITRIFRRVFAVLIRESGF